MSQPESTTAPSHVVGIGASAGGLDALERFFSSVPNASGMAFVVVQHLSPDFKSLMDELLARHTDLPIHLVENGMVIEADHVYLIPPKKEMITAGGRLLLSERDRQQEQTLPIDIFFRSLAQDYGPRAVAIVLSGGGSDGSRGVRDVHEAGGKVLVQDVDSAQFDGMPKSARDSGVASFVLAPEDMPRILLEHAANPPVARAELVEPQGIDAVYRMLETEFGIDFTHYKPSTVTRRIERRLGLSQSLDLAAYVERLRRDRDELDLLYRDLLIGVTRFFRDEGAFEALEQKVLPELWKRVPEDTPLRLWVAGCATGEEPYSIAIVLQELMARLGERPVKIFATDVHPGSLERASRAIYDEEALAKVSRERMERYFVRLGDTYQVVPEIRQMVVFAAHNVIKDPPFTRMDLITCRNLLIYLQPQVQQRVLSLFHFALNPGGMLMLGPSESIGPMGYGFDVVDKRWQVSVKHSDVRVPVESRLQPAAYSQNRAAVVAQEVAPRHPVVQLLATYDVLLDEYMPPALLLGERGELVHAFGGASRFMRVRDGRQSLDVLDFMDSELKVLLAGALKRALQESSPIVFKGVRLVHDGQSTVYKVTLRRVRSRPASAAHLLVTFEAAEPSATPPAPEGETELELGQVSREQLSALETELSHTKENLQEAIEELQASNEELQASNEELQASNEELQSTNEELQSVNEELYTVNAEYQRKITELTELTNDIDNLLASTEVGTIFLDAELRIRKFTPKIGETVSLMAHDLGRSIETFAHKMEHPDLLDDLHHVLASGELVERELRRVGGKSGKTHFLRILPYKRKGLVDGVVLTLIDVSGLKAAEDALFHERYLLNSLLVGVPDAIGFKDARGRFIRANQAMATRLGLAEPRAAAGKTALELPNQQAAVAMHGLDQIVLTSGAAQHDHLERQSGRDDAWDLATRLPLHDPAGKIVGLITIFRDVTHQKIAEHKLQDAMRRRDEFLAMLSHELRNPLGAMLTATSLLRDTVGEQPSTQKLFDILGRQLQQMARLLDDLLEVSRVTQNKIELRKRLIDLTPVVREAVDAMRAAIDARGLELTLDLDERPLELEADPARIQQIFVNLLSNAVKYTQQGGHVTLRAHRDGRHAVISVRDDGAGIPADLIDSVFDLFVQSRRTLDRSAGGLGVGLTLVRSLVAMHGGTVVAHSEGEGRGSELVVRLPLAEERGRLDSPPPRRKAATPRGARVLLVEDSVDSRELLCALLQRAGFDCRAAESGAAALDLIDEFGPEIAILDLGMPEMDGLELAQRIRGHARLGDMHLIALTGYGQASDRARVRQAGFDHHLVKPVQADELVDLLGELCEQVR